MSSENILVTGGAGYIGSHTCKALAAKGLTPVSYDNLSNGHRYAVKWGPLEVGDILDGVTLGKVIEKYRPAAVIHFAALAYVGDSVREPARYWRNNVAGSLSLIDAMMSFNVHNLVFSSTCAIYGEPEKMPISEETRKSPVNPYGTTKLVIENYLADLAATGKLNAVSLRYFNAAGADPDGEAGEDHEPETHLIPLVIRAAQNDSHITLFGDDYNTQDGTCVRDYIHVTDLADAHVLALDYLETNSGYHAFNLGTDVGHSVRQVIDTTTTISGRKVPFDIGPRRAGDPAVLVSHSAKAKQQLAWKPKYEDLNEIITSAWAWHNR